MRDTVKKELLRIRKQHRGKLLPAHVVEAAKSKESPLHNHFQWDDTEAAHQYRLWQARQLISVVVRWIPRDVKSYDINVDYSPRTSPDVELQPVREFISLGSNRKSKRGYDPVDVVLSSPAKRREWLNMAIDELERFREKYNTLQELAGVFESIDALKRQVEEVELVSA